jgi:F0F1-type ATP synthase membrane subunit c/vacuolar-type H+-ATPase subunit K
MTPGVVFNVGGMVIVGNGVVPNIGGIVIVGNGVVVGMTILGTSTGPGVVGEAIVGAITKRGDCGDVNGIVGRVPPGDACLIIGDDKLDSISICIDFIVSDIILFIDMIE